ncbi:MAG: EAL domain-containing protein [Actinobacteria bacterium]|nr:EAL domain-containing protein [Actinomycetota bacterium]MCG2798216.1 EAL domain-containing protein [Cellulomonas sp.]
MTGPSSDSAFARLAAAVDESIPPELVEEWQRQLGPDRAFVARQGIFSPGGRAMAYELSFRSTRFGAPSSWSRSDHERATAHVLRVAFGPEPLDNLPSDQPLFVRCTQAHLVGDLPLPDRPDRLVLELPRSLEVDTRILIGIEQLRRRGFRVALPSFSDRPSERRLLPLTDYVKIDVRDLDVEGHPVVRVARSCGAMLIGEFVERADELAYARELGLNLFQGNLLQRADLVDQSLTPRAGL